MTRDVSSSRAAARALNARNPAGFDAIHSRDECVRRLAALTTAPSVKAADEHRGGVATRFMGTVDGERVDLRWHAARFEGRWVERLDAVRLEGVTSLPRPGLAFLVPAALALFAAAIAVYRGHTGLLVLLGLVVAIALPLVVLGVGSARVASEIELVRRIGQAIGDPEKYAARWRTWQDD